MPTVSQQVWFLILWINAFKMGKKLVCPTLFAFHGQWPWSWKWRGSVESSRAWPRQVLVNLRVNFLCGVPSWGLIRALIPLLFLVQRGWLPPNDGRKRINGISVALWLWPLTLTLTSLTRFPHDFNGSRMVQGSGRAEHAIGSDILGVLQDERFQVYVWMFCHVLWC